MSEVLTVLGALAILLAIVYVVGVPLGFLLSWMDEKWYERRNRK